MWDFWYITYTAASATQLPFTGSNTLRNAALGVLTFLAGAGLLVIGRRAAKKSYQ